MQALPSAIATALPPSRPMGGGLVGASLTPSIASLVPDAAGLAPVPGTLLARAVQAPAAPVALRPHEPGLALGRILHPALAPSAVASENALMARSLMTPLHVHDSAASRMARLSNPLRDAPRFGGSVNLLA